MTTTANPQQQGLREDLRHILGMPLDRCELAPESRVPCALYRPAESGGA